MSCSTCVNSGDFDADAEYQNTNMIEEVLIARMQLHKFCVHICIGFLPLLQTR